MKFLKHLEGIFSSKIAFINGIYKLFLMEAKLAELNLYPLLLSIALIVAALFGFLLIILSFLAYILFRITAQPLIVFAILIIINVLILYFLIRKLKVLLEQMSFRGTRTCLQKYSDRKVENEPTKEEADRVDYSN